MSWRSEGRRQRETVKRHVLAGELEGNYIISIPRGSGVGSKLADFCNTASVRSRQYVLVRGPSEPWCRRSEPQSGVDKCLIWRMAPSSSIPGPVPLGELGPAGGCAAHSVVVAHPRVASRGVAGQVRTRAPSHRGRGRGRKPAPGRQSRPAVKAERRGGRQTEAGPVEPRSRRGPGRRAGPSSPGRRAQRRSGRLPVIRPGLR